MSFFAAFINRQFISYPPVPTASFTGQTAIITGASSGLGLEACRSLVQLGVSRVILACRDLDKGKAAAKDIEATTSCSPQTLQVWHLDMSSYASVLAFADKARAELPRLDVLLANAGIGTTKFRMTEDNEETITTNVVSTALLALLLHPKLRETEDKYDTQTHLTVTASELYEVANFKEREAPEGQLFATLSDEKKANMRDRYNVSKLLEILIVKQIAALAPLPSSNGGVVVNCVAPGFCRSDLHREHATNFFVRALIRLLARPTEVGGRTLVYGASSAAGPASHGQYLPDCRITEPRGLASGEEGVRLRERVWAELAPKLERLREGVTNLS